MTAFEIGKNSRSIVNAMITRIEVYNGYEPNVEFNFNIRQFFEGIAEEESETKKRRVTENRITKQSIRKARLFG